jgi:hypothetical protein
MAGQQLMHQPQPGQPLRHALSSGHAAKVVHHHHVVVVLGPIEPDKQHPPSSLWINLGSSLRKPATP